MKFAKELEQDLVPGECFNPTKMSARSITDLRGLLFRMESQVPELQGWQKIRERRSKGYQSSQCYSEIAT